MALSLPACPIGLDDSFGPWAGEACRGGFDFTLLFEESILAIPVQCIFLLVLPVRVWQLAKSDRKVKTSTQAVLKACACFCLVALDVALLALLAGKTGTFESVGRTRTTLPTTVLALVAALGLTLLSWLEHERTIRPSFVISAFLLSSILVDLVRARTLWLIGGRHAVSVLFTTTVALRAVMLLLETVGKRRILVTRHKNHTREATSSPLSRTVFFWLTSLFLKGYKKILVLDDLYPLETDLQSKTLHKTLTNAWEMVPDKSAPGILFRTWLGVFKGPLMAAVIPKLCLIGFLYAQPLLINAAVTLAGLPQEQPFNNAGYGLMGAYVIVYTGIAVSTGQYEWRVHRAGTMMRGSIIALLYQKTLRLDLASPSVSPEAALTLASTDSETIIQGIVQLHNVWGGLVEIGVGIYLIYREIGAACAMPVALAFFSLIVAGSLALPTGAASATWIKASQDRVTATSKALGSIKWLKVSGLNDVVVSVIRKLRIEELRISARFRKLLGVSMLFVICTPILTPVLTFSVFAGTQAGGDNTLTIAKAFTTVALLALINGPLSEITMSLPVLAMAMTSFQRIQDYLNEKERDDNRQSALGKAQGVEKGIAAAQQDRPSKGLEMHPLPRHTRDCRAPGHDFIASLQGKFSWKEESEPTIDISGWAIRPRTLTMVLGPVGCGKSTLLKALLGEFSAFDGAVYANYSGVSYCGQSPWLPNDTVRNLIVGGDDMDESWYRTVVEACALEQDAQNWPDGDNTAVGSKGIAMSGGQKHRIAIARAVYSRKELVVLDNVFSGLDSATEEQVFNNLFGSQGLLRSGDYTAVVATSDYFRASFADEILVLTDNGRVRASGPPASISKIIGPFPTKARPRSPDQPEPRNASDPGTQKLKTVVSTMEAQADSTRQLGDPKMYIFYAKGAGWFALTTFLICMVVFAFCQSFPAIWLKWWAEANEMTPNQDLGKWLGTYAALSVGGMVAIYLGIWQLFIVVINNSSLYFHDILLKTTSRAPLSFHASVDTGVTINRFSQDLQLIDMELPSSALGVAISLAFCVAQLALVASSSKYMAIFLPFILVTFYAVGHFYLRTSRQMRLLDIEYKAPLYTQLMETFEGLTTVHAFQWQDKFEQKNLRLLDDAQRPSYLLSCLQRWLEFTVDMLVAVLALILIIFTTTLREQIGPGYMGVALSSILAFGVTLKGVVTSWVLLEVCLGAVARVRSFADEVKPEGAADGTLTEPEDRSWPTQGAVELRGVTASYPTSGRVLHDITMSIQPGQKVAICGRTGSGKSSLSLCLLRMMDLDSGTIVIDGIDVSTVPHEHVRSRIAAVPQESYILNGTVRLNVDPTGAVTDEELVRVLQTVQLWNKIEQRGGLDAVIHEKFFSHGETQLLVFARAMVRKSRVLLLDEPNSNLDEEASAIIQTVLRSWFKDWTVIAIVHKLEAIVDFDRVAVLDEGKLIEYDNPRRLLEQHGAFKRLYDLSSPLDDSGSAE